MRVRSSKNGMLDFPEREFLIESLATIERAAGESLVGDLSASKLSFNSDRLRSHAEASARFLSRVRRTKSFHHRFRAAIAVVPFARREWKGRRIETRSCKILFSRSGTGIKTFQPVRASRRFIIYSCTSEKRRERKRQPLCRYMPSSIKRRV